MAITGLQKVTREYKPLNYVAEIRQQTGIGFSQTLDPDTDEYAPDHYGTDDAHTDAKPLVLTIAADAHAADMPEGATGLWSYEVAHDYASTIPKSAWRVNGKALNGTGQTWVENTDYALSADGKTLTVYRNIQPNEVVTIDCMVRFKDERNGDRFIVTTDAVVMDCTSLLEAPWELKLGRDHIKYCPESDDMIEHEYCAARGLSPAMSEAEAWKDSYLKSNEVFVTKGAKGGRKTTGYGYMVLRKTGTTNGEPDYECSAWIKADGTTQINDTIHIAGLTATQIGIDCRTIDNDTFEVRLLNSSNQQLAARGMFTVSRWHRPFEDVHLSRTSDFGEEDTEYRQEVIVYVNGEQLKYPEAYYDLKIVTCNQDRTNVKIVGTGNSAVFNPLEQRSGGDFFMGVDIEPHATLTPLLCEESGFDYWTDENGNPLLV